MGRARFAQAGILFYEIVDFVNTPEPSPGGRVHTSAPGHARLSVSQ